MKGRLIDLSVGMNGKQRITVEVDADFQEEYERLKDGDVDVDIKKPRKKFSKSANAYFHVLAKKIAECQGLGHEEVKISLVREYGTLTRNEDGTTVGFKLPASVNVDTIYPYVRCFDTRYEDGKEFRCYMAYKHTQDMDSKEMSRLIDGAIYVAQGLGIETDTPEQLARQRKRWAEYDKKQANKSFSNSQKGKG